MHALDIKEAQAQRDLGEEQLGGMKTAQLVDRYIEKRNKIRNQCALLKHTGEQGIHHYHDKLEEISRACNKLLRTWTTDGSPLARLKTERNHVPNNLQNGG